MRLISAQIERLIPRLIILITELQNFTIILTRTMPIGMN